MILDERYKLDPAISNSLMKAFVSDGPTVFFDTYLDPLRAEAREFSTESTDIGDLTDCLVTTPEQFNKYYYITGDVKLSAAQKEIMLAARALAIKTVCDAGLSAQAALEHPSVTTAAKAGDYFVAAARAYRDPKKNEEEAKKGYQGAWKDETMAKHFIEAGESFYSDLTIAAGRKIIDQSLFNIAEKKKLQMLEHENIGQWFKEKSTETVEVLFQHMVKVSINGVDCKILLDYCRIDHKAKRIVPKDVKTALSRKQFVINYEKYGYPNQGSFYTGVLQHKYPGYIVEPFEFIVACTDTSEEPIVYRMSQRELDVTRDGAVLKSGKRIAGWINTLEVIKWHMDSGHWRYPKEYYDNGFVVIDSYKEEGIEEIGSAGDEDIF